MVDRVSAAADQRVERGVIAQINRVAISWAECLQRRRFGNAVRQAHPGAQGCHIAFIIKEVGINHRRGRRIRAAQPHRSPAFGAQHAGVERKAVRLDLLTPVIFQHGGDKVPLHIGRGAIGHYRPETAGFGIGGGHHAGALAPMLDHRRHHPQAALQSAANRHIADRLPAGDIVDMILQVAAYACAIQHHVDPVGFQVICRADA